jgi:hypothetical protein
MLMLHVVTAAMAVVVDSTTTPTESTSKTTTITSIEQGGDKTALVSICNQRWIRMDE